VGGLVRIRGEIGWLNQGEVGGLDYNKVELFYPCLQ
jgi:hypothetical protein